MAAVSDLSDLVNRMTGGNSGTPENIFWYKYPSIGGTQVARDTNSYGSSWKLEGFPGSGATPTTAAVPTNSTAGAIPFTNPGGGREKWLVQAAFGCDFTQTPAILVYDRLLHWGGGDGTDTLSQTVGGSLTRNTGGVGNQIWVEIYSDVGATTRTITATYTNQAGTGSRSATADIGGTRFNEAGTAIPMSLQSGDTGVQSVQSVILSASTGTAGDFGITIARPIAYLSGGPGAANRDFTTGPGGMPEIETNACIAFFHPIIGSTAVGFQGMFATVEA
jgi:hypothetical protein